MSYYRTCPRCGAHLDSGATQPPVYRHGELREAFDRAVRKQRAHRYISRVKARVDRRIKRIFCGAVLVLVWAIVLAALVG